MNLEARSGRHKEWPPLPSDRPNHSPHSTNLNICVDGVTILSHVPANVTLSGFSSIPHSSNESSPPPPHMLKAAHAKSPNGAFLGLHVDKPQYRILNSIGRLVERKFLSIFRFKTWWSTMWVGSNGSDLQMETQLILLQLQEPNSNSYVLILPLIEGNFRAAIHPGNEGEVILCVESGSTQVKANSFSSCAYFHVGDNPFDLMRDAFTAIRVHLGTFTLENPPRIIDKFGWCSWDAFYLTVEPVGLWHGVKSFVENGFHLRFLIIDDGWQSINMDHENPFEDSKDLTGLGSQMLCRLYRFKENEKFAKYQVGTMLRPDAPKFDQEEHDKKFKEMVELAMKKKSLSNGGELDASSFPEARTIEYLKEIEGLERGGLKALLNDMKVKFPSLDDVYVWHALCGAWGGVRPGTTGLNAKITRAKLAAGLEKTMNDLAVDMIVKGGIGLVEPSQAAELYEVMHSYLADVGVTGVKIDVIHTLEYVGEDHGGRVQLAKAYYDGLNKSLNKNFGGSGLIASMEQCNDFFFLATKDISMGRVGDDFWFEDPNGDPMGVYWLQGVHMIHCSYNSLWQGQFIQPDWDMFQSDHFGGVVGVFNCQGAGWYPEEHKCRAYPQSYKPISGSVSSDNMEWEQKASTAQFRSTEQFAVYHHKSDELHLINSKEEIKITLQPSSFEIFTFSPVHRLNQKAKFAPVGLENMFNSGGAIENLEYESNSVRIKVKGTGKFLAYSSENPMQVVLNGEKVKFEWTRNGGLNFRVPWIGGELSDALIILN
ncbi:LOW QUALITY PROTEIN: Glycosyl hydrolases 36 [Dillenia turbinata]|uniref:galactinol--sucrose galactosyltransferase n=1 Tax=Dillenia turbinata TaxID=194707 RepID=A0AAN8UDY1_9MAGN